MKFNPALIQDWLSETALRLPYKTAIVCGKHSITYGQLDKQSTRLAMLLQKHGLRHHDRVIIYLENSIETIISLYGIVKAGGIFVSINGQLKSSKVAAILEDTEAAFMISSSFKARSVDEALKNTSMHPRMIWNQYGEKLAAAFPGSLDFQECMDDSIEPVLPEIETIDQDIAALLYTSGSTGQPKGVIKPHIRMISVAKSIIEYLKNTEEDVILNVLSLASSYGLYQALMTVMIGATIIIEPSFVYLQEILNKIPEYKVSAFPMVPTVMSMIFKQKNLESFDFSSIRYITNAGAALPIAYSRKIRSLWPHIDIYPMYGLTECVRVCYLDPKYIDEKPDSIGFEIPQCKVFIVDENGSPVGPNEVGELVITGTNVMSGYWRKPELTVKTFRPGNHPGQTHLYSGDLFRRDEQDFLYYVSRKDDMIKSRGEKVYPLEVENILLQIDGITEAAVIGVKDEMYDTVIKAFLVKEPDAEITEKEILRFCAKNMDNHMIPAQIVFLEELPKNPNKKVNKLQLKNSEES